MRRVFLKWRVCLAGFLVTATSVFGQAFELDLTEKAQPKPAEEFRPTLAIVAVRTLESDGALTPWLFLGADAGHAALAPAGERSALVCWTEHGEEGDRVRVVRLTRSAR